MLQNLHSLKPWVASTCTSLTDDVRLSTLQILLRFKSKVNHNRSSSWSTIVLTSNYISCFNYFLSILCHNPVNSEMHTSCHLIAEKTFEKTIPGTSSSVWLLKLYILALSSLFSWTTLRTAFSWSFSCLNCSFLDSKAATVSSRSIVVLLVSQLNYKHPKFWNWPTHFKSKQNIGRYHLNSFTPCNRQGPALEKKQLYFSIMFFFNL